MLCLLFSCYKSVQVCRPFHEQENKLNNSHGYFEDANYIPNSNYIENQKNVLYSSKNIRFVNKKLKKDFESHQYDDDDDDDEDEDDLIDNNEEDDDEEDDILFNGNGFFNGVSCFKQAQPVHKKYASTGFLFNRYLAPIEESSEETVNLITQKNFNEIEVSCNFNDNRYNYNKYETSINDDNALNKIKYLNSANLDQNISLKGSTSCFDLTSLETNTTCNLENDIESDSKFELFSYYTNFFQIIYIKNAQFNCY